MKTMFWLAVIGSVALIAFILRYVMRKISDRERESDARAAEFMAKMAAAKLPAAPPLLAPAPPAAASVPHPDMLETQKLLFEAARKAGDAGEPAIAIQLYARLLSRFPESGLANEARAAAEAQKKGIKA